LLTLFRRIDWEKLKTKYLVRQEVLEQEIKAVLDEMNGKPVTSRKPVAPPKPDHTTFITDIRGPRPPIVRPRKTSTPSQDQSSKGSSQQPDYEQVIVVHVDNIQPRTNKSILKVKTFIPVVDFYYHVNLCHGLQKLFEKSGAVTTFINFKKDIPTVSNVT
jgi:hypothetical protein